MFKTWRHYLAFFGYKMEGYTSSGLKLCITILSIGPLTDFYIFSVELESSVIHTT